MDEKEEDPNAYYYVPSGIVDDESEPMDIPNVGDFKYFTFPSVRKSYTHPADGIISSRILPDESNLVRYSTDMKAEFEVPEEVHYTGFQRMCSDQYQQDYANAPEKPVVLYHGEILLGLPK